jgi:hypothetical protein
MVIKMWIESQAIFLDSMYDYELQDFNKNVFLHRSPTHASPRHGHPFDRST